MADFHYIHVIKYNSFIFAGTTVLELHFHVAEHVEGGSYFYNSLLQTAYPKYSFSDVACQTDEPVEEAVEVKIASEPTENKTVESSSAHILQTISRPTLTNLNELRVVKIENSEPGDDHLSKAERNKDFSEICSGKSAEVSLNGLLQPTRNLSDFFDDAEQTEDIEDATCLNTLTNTFPDCELPLDTQATPISTEIDNKKKAEIPADFEPSVGSIGESITVNTNGNIDVLVENLKQITKSNLELKNEGIELRRSCRRHKPILNLRRQKRRKTENIQNKPPETTKVGVRKNLNRREQRASRMEVPTLSESGEESGDGETDMDNDMSDNDSVIVKKNYRCADCNKIIKFRPCWEKHIERKHYHSYSLQCEKCFYPFYDEEEVKIHICSLVDTHLHECLQCEDKKPFRYMENLRKHVELKHNGKYPLKCEKCRKMLLSELEKRKHMVRHDPTLLWCSFCQKQLKGVKDFDSHMTLHTGEKKYQCHLCDKKWRNRFHFKNHLVRQHNIGAKQYVSEKGSKLFMCDKCGLSFAFSNLLVAHRRLACGGPPFECSQCGKAFQHRCSLDKHKRRHAGLLKTFMCDKCGESFTHITSFKSHVKYRHTREKDFKCSMCDKAFVRIGTLHRHERVHLKIRPYTCDVCNKEFSTRWNLKAHMRQHTGDTPYVCSVCGQGFAHNVVRKTHEAKCMRNDV